MFKDKTIVYTSGTFDMFHYNHLRMINYARSLADILIVGVSTDELVSSYKANPIIPFNERLQIIEALKTPYDPVYAAVLQYPEFSTLQ